VTQESSCRFRRVSQAIAFFRVNNFPNETSELTVELLSSRKPLALQAQIAYQSQHAAKQRRIKQFLVPLAHSGVEGVESVEKAADARQPKSPMRKVAESYSLEKSAKAKRI
jgi:hypothetical protein